MNLSRVSEEFHLSFRNNGEGRDLTSVVMLMPNTRFTWEIDDGEPELGCRMLLPASGSSGFKPGMAA
jgi:hypothetical protein